MGVVAFLPESELYWLRCVGCGRGFVREWGVTLPGAQPFDVPKGLPNTEAAVWAEIRSCLAAGAFTASAMMCRKLLFHVAVATGLPAKDKSNRAPTYAQCVNHLEAEGVITKRMRTWVDRIKDIGNDANHEITPVTEKQALDVAGFTHQLLRLSYEMDELVKPDDAEDEGQGEILTI
ncbi:uncharacterized protein DUF4145 [Propionicimonas paludicola]|uniref:Uncharacterized protein DUF4145 n=2 Tax=Propionicimonas paludicola TaxID=185243 RepID=A0A2A9CR80_9ACTN|nr:uncharacterized protein DUF4145 [Propionicimonas paludicola]